MKIKTKEPSETSLEERQNEDRQNMFYYVAVLSLLALYVTGRKYGHVLYMICRQRLRPKLRSSTPPLSIVESDADAAKKFDLPVN